MYENIFTTKIKQITVYTGIDVVWQEFQLQLLHTPCTLTETGETILANNKGGNDEKAMTISKQQEDLHPATHCASTQSNNTAASPHAVSLLVFPSMTDTST